MPELHCTKKKKKKKKIEILKPLALNFSVAK